MNVFAGGLCSMYRERMEMEGVLSMWIGVSASKNDPVSFVLAPGNHHHV